MSSSEDDTEELPTVIVSLNISETMNITINGSVPKTFMKSPDDDKSIHNILVGIGLVVVILVILAVCIRYICICIKECQKDDDVKDLTKQSTALLQPQGIRRNSIPRRSSISVQAQMEFREKRLSLLPYETPPNAKKS